MTGMRWTSFLSSLTRIVQRERSWPDNHPLRCCHGVVGICLPCDVQAGRPWNVSTVFHLYAIAALGLAALLICQANSRYFSAARR